MLLTIPLHFIVTNVYILTIIICAVLGFLFSLSAEPISRLYIRRPSKHIDIIKKFKQDAFYIFVKNPGYSYYLYFHEMQDVETGSVYSNYGRKIGSITQKRLFNYKIKDTRKYVFTSKKIAWLYFFLYPILRIISFLFSVLAIFTNKFYVQISAPKDYNKCNYNKFLLCFFDIVYKSSEYEFTKIYFLRRKY